MFKVGDEVRIGSDLDGFYPMLIGRCGIVREVLPVRHGLRVLMVEYLMDGAPDPKPTPYWILECRLIPAREEL